MFCVLCYYIIKYNIIPWEFAERAIELNIKSSFWENLKYQQQRLVAFTKS